MARKYRKIDPRVWKDETFRNLSTEEKLVTFYLITAQSNRVGLFAFSPAMAAEDLGMPAAKFAKCFERVTAALEWAYDRATRVLWIPTWWRYNVPENEKHFKGCLSDVADVPDCDLVARFLERRSDLPPYAASILDSYGIAIGWIAHEGRFQRPDSYAISGAGAGAGAGAEQRAGARDGVLPDSESTPEPERGEDVPIPPELDTPEFRDAWLGRWLPWRRSKEHGKNRPVSVLAARAQLAKLAPCGPVQACAAIAASISNDWQGLFPERVAQIKPRHAGSNVDPATIALLDAEKR